MSCLLEHRHIQQPTFQEHFGTSVNDGHQGHHHYHHHHQSTPFPYEHFLNGKSPRLISASWETLERLPRMSPPTSEAITTHLLSNSSPTSSSYSDSVLYKIICTPEFVKSAKESYIQPMLDTEFNQIVLPVECGKNCAFMYLTRLCQGSKGPCVLFNSCYWLTPNEFQSISGRNSAKDWKRSIRHNGKSIKLLINKGILTVHSPLCDCAYGSGIEPFVEKYAASPPIIESPSLDTRIIPYGLGYSEGSHSDGGVGGSEEDPDQEEKILFCARSTEGERETLKLKIKRVVSSPDNEEHHQNEREDYLGGGMKVKSEDGEINDEFDDDDVEDASAKGRVFHIAPEGDREDYTAAADNQGEESPSSLSISNLSKGASNGGGGGDRDQSSGSAASTGHVKSKRKPSSKQVHQHKPSSEQQSPTHLSSTTSSPPMTPPPPPPPPQVSSQSGGGNANNHNNNNISSGGSSSPPQQPIKQMEQMMTGSTRNYSDFMRTLAAKYNHQQSNHNNDYFPNLSFDTRFLKPSAAAAFLNFSQLPSPVLLDKEKFPLIDMSSTQTLLSMMRSASAAAAAAAVTNNNNNNNNTHNNNNNNNDCFKSSSGGGVKRPNSPLDLSSRDVPPLKKGKLKGMDLMNLAKPGMMMTNSGTGMAACLSSCSSGCSEEAQTMVNWSVEEVCQFVATIDLCKDYVEIFREHSIDGTSLPQLTEEHLMTAMNMKLGPALKFRSTVAKKLGNCVVCSHCTHCHNHSSN